MCDNKVGHVNSVDFDKVVTKLREFCKGKGFIEVHTQSRLSILAACEDPSNLTTYNYAGNVYPLPQTGQMWLEYELLKMEKESERQEYLLNYLDKTIPFLERANKVKDIIKSNGHFKYFDPLSF